MTGMAEELLFPLKKHFVTEALANNSTLMYFAIREAVQ
jgi:hypothetical protein